MRSHVINKGSRVTHMIVGQTNTGTGLNVSDLPPDTYTIQFSFTNLPPSSYGGNAIPDVWAEVTWFVDGQQQRRVISVSPGVSVTGQGEGVNVTYFDKSSLGSGAIAGSEYYIQSTLSKGGRADSLQPPSLRSSPRLLLNPGDTGVFKVPEDSGVISFYASVLLTSQTTLDTQALVQWRQSQGGVNTMWAGDALKINGWIPLMPGADQVNILYANVVGAPIINANILWGIQG